MKNTIKNFGIIAIVAVIGFALSSCLTLGGGSDDGVVGDGGFGRSMVMTAEWPSEATWAENGITGGLQQPSGTTVGSVGIYSGIFAVQLVNANKAAFDNLVNQIERQGGWTVYERDSNRREETVSFIQGGKSVGVGLDIRENTVSIVAATDNR